MPANPALRAGLALCTPAVGLVGCHCVTAFCGLRPLVLPGEVSPCEPPQPASQLYPRLPKSVKHTRPGGIHAPGHSFGLTQTMLFALANVGPARMGRAQPQQT